jgi:molybdopterin-guanine dinucleotide biosynthesis protein A
MESKLLPSRFGDSPNSNLLQYVLDSVWTVADDILVIFNKEPDLSLIESVAPFGVKVVLDKEGSSPFSRITTGFRASSSENCLVVSSSAPFVKPNVLFELFEGVHGFDAAVPRWKNGKIEPLLSVYSRKAFLRAGSHLRKRSLGNLVNNLYDVAFIGIETQLKQLDPELYSFFRVEDVGSLKKARRIATSKAGN